MFLSCYSNELKRKHSSVYIVCSFHYRCGGCDTLFPSLMLLEHHKEEYEHWSDSDEYQSCCRRNRRDDCDYSDSETCTSDAESEDLERLL